MASTSSSNTIPLPQMMPGEATRPARPQILTADQIKALADGLLSRGAPQLQKDTPHLAGDLRTAGHVIRGLLSNLGKVAGNLSETQRLPAEIAIQVEA